MSDHDDEKFRLAEEYEDAYFYFIKTLDILSENPIRQCDMMGYFNVAWELRDDACKNGNAVLNLPGGQLSFEQREAIIRLLQHLNAIPDCFVNVDNIKEEHERVMNSDFWSSIRSEAITIRKIINNETERVNSILYPSDVDGSSSFDVGKRI